MLYEDITTGALVLGHSLDKKLTAGRAAEIRSKLDHVNAKHSADVQLFVPGDSVTDHAGDPEMMLSSSAVYFGLSAEASPCFEAPHPVSIERVSATYAKIAAIPAAFWTDLAADIEELPEGFGAGEPSLYLMCYGPLPQVVLAFGAKHPREERSSAKYKFFTCQDMDQSPLDMGVDGVDVEIDEIAAYTEFDDALVVPRATFSEGSAAELAAKVPSLDAPGFFLTVRYD